MAAESYAYDPSRPKPAFVTLTGELLFERRCVVSLCVCVCVCVRVCVCVCVHKMPCHPHRRAAV